MILLKDIACDCPLDREKDSTKKELKEIQKEIAIYHDMLMAEKKQSLLVVIQGMDSSGKDGVTREVFKRCSPAGLGAFSFKKPTDKEFAHDFLWRVHPHVPEKGRVQVFIRSHYEDVLIHRVHNWIGEEKAQARYAAINAFEQNLIEDSQTTILKLFLHISKEKQLEKLTERMEVERKFWKHNDNDWKEREHWDKYQWAYESAFEYCNQPAWTIIPANQRWYRNYLAAKTVLETLKQMNPSYPALQTDMQ